MTFTSFELELLNIKPGVVTLNITFGRSNKAFFNSAGSERDTDRHLGSRDELLVSSHPIARGVRASAFFYRREVVDRITEETDMSRGKISRRVACSVRPA
ncbi:hypothetical protein J6590_000971 [Homalodisca vitripennis]|nr:hypothetical protein J6590_000971 [Homalodisca vitripennis]